MCMVWHIVIGWINWIVMHGLVLLIEGGMFYHIYYETKEWCICFTITSKESTTTNQRSEFWVFSFLVVLNL